jgi:hypothetical protein
MDAPYLRQHMKSFLIQTGSSQTLSLLWLVAKVVLYLLVAMGSMEIVVVAYQQF